MIRARLSAEALTLLREDPPFVLMTLRGRVYLRMQMEEPEPIAVAQAVALFQAGAQAALRVGGGLHETNAGWASTASSAWQNQIPPEDPQK